MERGFAPEEAAFRAEVREFVRSKLPLDLRHKVIAGEALASSFGKHLFD